MHAQTARQNFTAPPYFEGAAPTCAEAKAVRETWAKLNFVRLLAALIMAFGYSSTMARGPNTPERLLHMGYEPSWIAVQVLFFFSGFLALASLRRHGSVGRLWASRMRRVLPSLAIVTAIVTIVLYPMLKGVAPIYDPMTRWELGRYFVLTTLCLQPGQPLPGTLDHAVYACLLQGAIWTLRIGVLAYLVTGLAWIVGALRHSWVMTVFAVLLATLYFFVHLVNVTQTDIDWSPVESVLRLAYPFMAGMAVYAGQHHLPHGPLCKAALLLSFIGIGVFNAAALPWTPVIEMSLSAFYAYGALLIVQSEAKWLRWTENWPHLVLGVFILNWPIAQVIVFHAPGISDIALIATVLPLSLIGAGILRGLTRSLDRLRLGEVSVERTRFQPVVDGA